MLGIPLWCGGGGVNAQRMGPYVITMAASEGRPLAFWLLWM